MTKFYSYVRDKVLQGYPIRFANETDELLIIRLSLFHPARGSLYQDVGLEPGYFEKTPVRFLDLHLQRALGALLDDYFKEAA